MRILRLLPRFQEAYRAVHRLAERELWPRSQIEAYQLDALNRLWQHAIRHVPHYCSLRGEHSLPQCFASLDEFRRQVPLLPKRLVKQEPQRFLSEVARPGCWERTSGSTGMPMSIYHDVTGHRTMLHAKYRFYESWGIDILDRSAYLWARADAVTPGIRGMLDKWQLQITDAVRSRKRFSAFNLDKKALGDCLRKLERYQARVLYGFSNAIFLLALEAAEQGFSCDSLKAVIMTSEPATPRMRALVAKAFGAPVAVEYGATECEFIAGLYPDGMLRVREDLVLLETLPNSTQGHDIVITVLGNVSFPLLRYQIEDVTESPLESPEQGFAVLRGGVAGRRDDLLQTRSGGFLHPTGIDTVFEQLPDAAAIRRYRVHQNRSGALEMQIEVDPARPFDVDLSALQQSLSTLVEGYPIHIDVTACLTPSHSSKHRAISSDLTADMTRAAAGMV